MYPQLNKINFTNQTDSEKIKILKEVSELIACENFQIDHDIEDGFLESTLNQIADENNITIKIDYVKKR